MDETYRRIREAIRRMPTKEAAKIIASFRLPEEEDLAVTLMDIKKMSTVQASSIMGVSPETVKRRRASAYARMAEELKTFPPEE